MQHEIAQPHLILSTTQSLVALFIGGLTIVTTAWSVGRNMGKFAVSHEALSKQVNEGFLEIKKHIDEQRLEREETIAFRSQTVQWRDQVDLELRRNSEGIHKLRGDVQAVEVRYAMLNRRVEGE